MSTIDQQFVEYIVKTLVNNPDKVEVKRSVDEKGVLLELTVDPEDVGRVIGRRGITAQSMRTLLRALGTKNDARYNLKIVNDDEGAPRSVAEDAPAAEGVAKEAASPAADAADETIDAAEEASAEEETFGDDEEDNTPGIAERTRAELADLDDLDI
ncbi:KH domain-containing protein [Candidatus Saccharibacteria bacterium]|nr:KH domain-containing protein [Candidatus Saccharibacteria bacterium]